jgi:tRNA dimethylallyltransferase
MKEEKEMYLIGIFGCTSSGKTNYSLELAQKLQDSGKIVWILNCDSRQIYKELKLGVGKPEGTYVNNIYEVDNIKHFLIDYVSFFDREYIFSITDYIQDYCNLLTNARLLPHHEQPDYVLLVGGTGLWAKAILDEYKFFRIADHYKSLFITEKEKLNKLSLLELQQQLLLQKQSLNNSEWNNPRRLINKILLNTAQDQNWLHTSFVYPKFTSVSSYFLDIDAVTLHSNISERMKLRLEAGLIEEVKNDITKMTQDQINQLGLLYRVYDDNKNHISVSEYSQWHKLFVKSEMEYAKRQMTWFKKQKNLHLINLNRQ